MVNIKDVLRRRNDNKSILTTVLSDRQAGPSAEIFTERRKQRSAVRERENDEAVDKARLSRKFTGQVLRPVNRQHLIITVKSYYYFNIPSIIIASIED